MAVKLFYSVLDLAAVSAVSDFLAYIGSDGIGCIGFRFGVVAATLDLAAVAAALDVGKLQQNSLFVTNTRFDGSGTRIRW